MADLKTAGNTKRPKGVTTFRTSADNKAKLQELARSENRTISNLVNRIIREALERWAAQTKQ